MTVAISLKVHDGLVLASDSASTIIEQQEDGAPLGIVNIYDNANKIANFCKGRPLGGMVWGAGSIGNASMSTLFKDLRDRFTNGNADWRITDENSVVERVAERTRAFLFDERYVATYGPGRAPHKPSMGVLVAGYSHGQELPESWIIRIHEGECGPPVNVQPLESVGCFVDGQPEAVQRFLRGYGTGLPDVLQNLGVDPSQLDEVMSHIASALTVPMIISAMPIQDAIDLADFLVTLTKMFSRFSPGAPSVGGPTEIAAITKHEGFKWIKRKHYFDQKLNP